MTTINNTSEQFTKTANNHVDTAHDFIKASLESMEKLTKLHLNASKKILDNTSNALKEMTEVKNPNELLEKVNQLASDSVEHNICNCRDMYEIMAEAQTKMGKLFETQLQTVQQHIVDATDNFSKLSPSKSNTASDSIKSWINTTNQAINAMTKAAGQVTEFANNNIHAAANATSQAVKKATSTAAKK